MERPLKSEDRAEVRREDGLEKLEARILSFDRMIEEKGAASEALFEKGAGDRILAGIQKLKMAAISGMALYTVGSTLYDVHKVHETHASTRYEITETKRPDGTIEYRHEDERTTEIMNFLTGEGDLPVEDRMLFYRQVVHKSYVEIAELQGTELTPEIEDTYNDRLPFDEAALREEYRNNLIKLDSLYAEIRGEPIRRNVDYERRVEEAFSGVIRSPWRNPDLASGLWELQENVGAPRVRWAASGDSEIASNQATARGHGRAFYVPSTNTVYITPGELIPTLLAENAHALQYHEEPFSSRIRYALDSAMTRFRAFTQRKSEFEAQLEEYDSEGSVEHQAHSVIEPGLKDTLRANMRVASGERYKREPEGTS